MPPLPLISSDEVIKAFGRVGYEVHHQRGSHVILRRSEPPRLHLSVPKRKELARGTLRDLIRDAGPDGRGVSELSLRNRAIHGRRAHAQESM